MGTVHKLLPKLVLNRPFVEDLMSAGESSFGMGIVEERKKNCAFLALRTAEEIPDGITAAGFSFGHSVYGTSVFEVIHFAFNFYN